MKHKSQLKIKVDSTNTYKNHHTNHHRSNKISKKTNRKNQFLNTPNIRSIFKNQHYKIKISHITIKRVRPYSQIMMKKIRYKKLFNKMIKEEFF